MGVVERRKNIYIVMENCYGGGIKKIVTVKYKAFTCVFPKKIK